MIYQALEDVIHSIIHIYYHIHFIHHICITQDNISWHTFWRLNENINAMYSYNISYTYICIAHKLTITIILHNMHYNYISMRKTKHIIQYHLEYIK